MSGNHLLLMRDRDDDILPVRQRELGNAILTILEGTSRQLGVEFLRSLVASLACTLGFKGALVAKCGDDALMGRILATYGLDMTGAEYPIAGSFAEEVLERGGSSANAPDFPRYSDGSVLLAMGIHSIIGMRLDSNEGRPQGLLMVLDDKSIDEPALTSQVLSIFAARAGAEMDRVDSEMRRDEVERNRLHDQKLDAIGTFAGGIAHDINNILTFIWGHAQILELKLSGSMESESVQGILSGCRRARDLARQILLFGRRLDPVKRPVHIDEIARETLSLLSVSVPPSIEVNFHSPADLPVVLGDSSQLMQVLTNLCTNAIHSMQDAVDGHLEIQLGSLGDSVRIVVADDGVGIPPEILPRIFEPFFSTKGINQGTGLGLSVVHGIVNNHGGTIEVRSVVGKGSRFDIVLPAHQPVLSSETSTLPVFVNIASGERILVVDDDPAITDILSHLLEILGYDFRAFNQPLEALEEFRRDPSSWSAAISDFSMPAMTGREFAKEMHRIAPDLPILLTSGYESIDPQNTNDPLERCTFIPKPFQAADLAKILRKCLEKR